MFQYLATALVAGAVCAATMHRFARIGGYVARWYSWPLVVMTGLVWPATALVAVWLLLADADGPIAQAQADDLHASDPE